MAILTCENCNGRFEVDMDMIGQVVGCPHCGSDIKVPLIVTNGARRMPSYKGDNQSLENRMVDRYEHGDGCLDFGLGLFLGPLGILIAAVIDKASGVRAAIRACWLRACCTL